MTGAGCRADARRRFLALFKLNGSPVAEHRRQWRWQYARPLHRWLTEKDTTSAPGGALHEAVTTALMTQREDIRVPPDNNRCERAKRPVVMVHKAWLDELMPYAEIPQQ